MKSKAKSLAVSHPELAKEAYGWDPQMVTAGSHNEVTWRCLKNHEYVARISNRTYLNRGCPYCSGRKVVIGENDLQTLFPLIAAEAHGWDPSIISPQSNKPLEWMCNKGHTWTTKPAHRTSAQSGCPYCSGRNLIKGETDLASTHPQLTSEAVGWDPTKYKAGSHEKVSWSCNKGHEWKAEIHSRTTNKSGCPVCSKVNVRLGINDLKTTNPALASQAHGWDPQTLRAGSAKSRQWICELGHVWKAQVVRRTDGNGCPYCAGKKVLAGFNDVATTHPELVSQTPDFDLTTVTIGTRRKVHWVCPEGHSYYSKPWLRVNGGGCPTCTKFGFDPNIEGWIYLIQNEELGLLQIGISNYPKKRLQNHKRRGWTLIDLRGPLEGDVAFSWEQAILKSLKKNKANFNVKDIAGNYSGYTESWIAESYPATRIKDLMDLVDNEEAK